jgi:hypothetical protein
VVRLASVTQSGSVRGAWDGDMDAQGARVDQGRHVIAGHAFVFTTKGRRAVHVRLDRSEVTSFEVPLPAAPGREHMVWSNWLPAGAGGFDYRFRVRRFEDEKREELEKKAQRQKHFQSLPSNAPIEEYLAYLDDQDWDVRNRTTTVVSARPAELIPLLESRDRRKIELALQAAAVSGPLPASFEEPLLGVLRGTLQDLKNLRRTEATDPDELEAKALQRLFINWFTSWRNSHQERKVVPTELAEVLEEALKMDRSKLADAAQIGTLGKQYLSEWRGGTAR